MSWLDGLLVAALVAVVLFAADYARGLIVRGIEDRATALERNRVTRLLANRARAAEIRARDFTPTSLARFEAQIEQIAMREVHEAIVTGEHLTVYVEADK